MSGAFFRAGLMKSIAPVRLFFNLFNKFRMFVLRRADAFVTISSVISDEYAGAGITGERVSYIPNGIDPALFSPVGKGEKSELRSKLGVDDVAFIAIYTGRLVRYKGVMTLIDAWEEVVRKHPESRLLLVGAGGNDMHNCEDELRVRAGHLSDSVIFVGDVNNVRDYLCASDVFLFPTENEAFGISLIEAMGCGLPVISTVVGGIKDFLFDRRNGLVFEQGDSEMLAKLIMEVYEDAVLRERLASAAVDTVLEKFSQSLITDRYIGLFRSLEEL
jgi:glycosyltransferase involved in cell wall biosynthesis